MPRKLLPLTLAIAAAVALPTTANAYEIIGKQLEIYGKAHVSADFVDNDTDSELAIASNSSRLGFKGVTEINTYVGLTGDFGQVLVGNQDTPLKNVRNAFDLFGDTVGDARNIADEANRRAKNSIQYVSPSMGGLVASAMYATSFEDWETEDGDIEDNDYSLASVALGYSIGDLAFSAGYEKADGDDEDTVDADVVAYESDAFRLAASYAFGPVSVGAMFDRYEEADAERDAWGLNTAYKFGANTLKLQYMTADDWSDTDDTGASQVSLGLDHKLSKQLTVYGVYNMLKNDDNTAAYRIKGGHDTDVYQVAAAGDDINVFSLGMVYSF